MHLCDASGGLTFVLHFTFGASCGYEVDMLKLKVKTPPLQVRALSKETPVATYFQATDRSSEISDRWIVVIK